MSKFTVSTPLPHLEINRTIHPVGQGAFYSESFKSQDNLPIFTAVYDCGGRKAALSRERRELSRVDIIFLSHFHEDHFNGLLDLKNMFNTPIVVIPCISPCRFLVDYTRNSMKDKSGKAGSLMLKFLPIIKSGQEGMLNDHIPTRCVPIKKGEGRSFPIEDTNPRWEYDVFYEENDTAEHRLLELIKDVLKLPDTYSENYLEEKVYKDIADKLNNKATLLSVKKAYAKVFKKGHNSYSMLVLSHEVKPSPESEGKHFDCLYTGDIQPQKWVVDKARAYNPDYVQVPHHGSKHNHNPALYSSNPTVFISVGETNRYHHPSLSTLRDLYASCKKVNLVTEFQGADFCQVI